VVEKQFQILNASGDPISGDLRYEDDGTLKPTVLVCHGFTAHKDWGPFPLTGRRLASLGFASVVFNFSHNGIGQELGHFTETEKFSKNTVGKELEDVRAVLDALMTGAIGEGACDLSRIGIVGHSRGGGIAILSASRDERLTAVAAWSGVATFFRYTKHQQMIWRVRGFMPVTIRSLRTKLRQSLEILEDLELNRAAYDLPDAVRGLAKPLLLVHGREDLVVKPAEAEKLYEVSDHALTELVLVDGAGHTFGIRSPFAATSGLFEFVLEKTARWFRSHVGGGTQ
jgi:dienelactone hydrolase